MGRRDFEQNFRDLEQISDKGAHIYGSELCRDILQLGPDCLDLLKMQLEQEQFFRLIRERDLHGLSDQTKLSRMFLDAVGTYLEEWLNHYDIEDRRGVLLELLTALDSCGHWTEEELAVAARLTVEQLTILAAKEVVGYAVAQCAQYATPDCAEDGMSACASGSVFSTAAALSIAAYAEYPDLRVSPELIAFASSAAANTARVERQKEAGEVAGVSAYMELMLAAVSLVEAPEVPTVNTFESGKTGEADCAKKWFKAFLALFFADLVFLLGAAAAGVIMEAAAILANLADAAADETGGLTARTKQVLHTQEDNEEEEQEEESDNVWQFD